MTLIANNKDIKKDFLSNFIPQEFPGNPILLKLKKEAEAALQQLEFPTTRDEQWKYTRVSKILKNKYTQTPDFSKSDEGNFEKILKIGDSHLFVFINVFFSTKFSSLGEEEGAVILPLSKARKENIEIFEKYFGQQASHQKEIFTALNTVYHTNGAFVFLGENVVLKKPVHIVNVGSSGNAAFNPRNLFVLGKNSEASLVISNESFAGGIGNKGIVSAFSNAVSEVYLHENANLSCHFLQMENEFSSLINTLHAKQLSGSRSEFFTFSSGGSLVRNNLTVSIDGENCECHLNGLYIGSGEQHFDNHTLVEHKKPHSYSNEFYKGIMNDKSTGVFNGKVFVYKDAQKTNAYQSNQNILLSDDATVDSKPELEIYADDVKCSHGSTTGQLDEEAVFYLRSRGIGEKKAKDILIHAFAGEIVEKIKFQPVREIVKKMVEKKIG